MKNGTAAPNTVSVANFATATPSSLFDEIVKISSATITPCNVAPAVSNKMVSEGSVVSLKTGSRISVTKNAATAGSPSLADR